MSDDEAPVTPTFLQNELGGPLRSEQRVHHFFPRKLSHLDMMALFVLLILYIPNVSVVQIMQGAGPWIYLYWACGFALFMLPGAFVIGQLNRFLPADGSVYAWTHRALGDIWGFFAGFCAWLPGVLNIFATSFSALTFLRTLVAIVQGSQPTWLATPWQDGIFILGFILLSGALSLLPLSPLMKWTKVIVGLYLVVILLLGGAGIVWLLTGHTSQIALATDPARDWPTMLGIFGFIILALFGLEVPFNVASETKRVNTARVGLIWGSILIGVGYLIGTFGLTTVLSLKTPPSAYTVLAALYTVFGWPVVLIASSVFFVFVLCAATIFNVTFARILFVAALDSRLPVRLTRLNRYKAPYYATNVQTCIILCLAFLGCIVAPLLFPDISNHFTTQLYDILLAVISVIWFLSMIFLFLDLPVLLRRVRGKMALKREGLMIPIWAVYLCCVIGIITTCIGILTVLSSPFDTFFSADSWLITVGVLASVILLLGLVGAAYPRLLSSVREQTVLARENARLYEDVRVAYEKLYQLDQMKDAFLSTVSHELRTPLTIVQGYVELLAEMTDEHLDPEIRRAFINNVRRGCDELSLLLANIMDASTLQLDTATLRCTKLPLKEVCVSVLDLFEQVIVQQRRKLDVNIPADCIVYADETRLKQVLRNLITNALRYSPVETPLRIKVTFENERTCVRIAVTDRGYGVPLEKQSIIFDRFVRLERDMHGDVRGSGLGLAICRQLVEAMGGTIAVESSGVPGEGATFSFTLPVERPEPAMPNSTDL